MKAAIWKVAPDGAYEFRGAHVGQLTLGLDPDFEPLKRQLLTEFGDGKWHTIEAVQKFTRSDKTDYHSGQLKTQTLKPMELDGLIEADPTTRKRPRTYPDGCRLRFKQ